jgi:hypothetical protein
MATQLVKFPKQTSKISARAAIRKWQKQQPAPRGIKIKSRPVKAVKLNRAALDQLRAIVESVERGAPATRARGSKDANTQQVMGTLYSAFTTYEYMLMRGEYARRRALAVSPFAQLALQTQWRRIVGAAQTAFKVGGLTVTESTLNGYVQQLTSNGAYLATVIKLRQTAVVAAPTGHLTAGSSLLAAFVPTVATVADPVPAATSIATICATPLTQGSFTKHAGGSVALRVRVTYWCPTWSDWTRTCTKTVTLASASYAMDINVGYKVTCCGATAWGQASAQACASVLWRTWCAGCTGSIVGVAGVSRTPVGANCSYGLGITLRLQCVLGGLTLLDLSYNFGWVITGPCPPAGACA